MGTISAISVGREDFICSIFYTHSCPILVKR